MRQPAVSPPVVSLTMIVKNEAANLGDCLACVVDLVDEIIVIDTGSTDQTQAISECMGAKVFDFPWIDDFAAARNQALRHATGKWIFWLDADDRIDASNRARLGKLFASLRDETIAYHMGCLSSDPGGSTLTDHVRLFRNDPEIRWKHRIHEQILPAIRASGGVSKSTDVVIHHTGYQDPVTHRAKLQRNLKLLELENSAHPGEAAVLYHLGGNYTAVGRPLDAIRVLKEGLDRSRDGDPFVRNFYGQLARAHHQAGQRAEAIEVCRQGMYLFPDDAELLFVQSALLTESGDLASAEKQLLKLVDPKARFVSSDTGLTSYKSRQNLAMLYRKQNRLAEAETQLRLVLRDHPQYSLARLALADVCLAQNKPAEVQSLLQPISGDPTVSVDVALLVARAHLAGSDLDASRAVLETASARSPGNLRLLTLLTQVLLQQGSDAPAAEAALRDILRIDPNHAGAKRTLVAMGLQ